jgi:hypothetical protein
VRAKGLKRLKRRGDGETIERWNEEIEELEGLERPKRLKRLERWQNAEP